MHSRKHSLYYTILRLILVLLLGCFVQTVYGSPPLTVTATAYITKKSAPLGAWGDVLDSKVNSIAVSRDLLALGLSHKTLVKIEGLEGEYLVLDKMAKRWKRKIDIYMGNDLKAAKRWGKRTVTIRWKRK